MRKKTSAIKKEYKETVVKLEKEKIKNKKDLELEMKRFAKLSKKNKLAIRKYRVGHAPNDWKEDDEIWRLIAD